MCVSLFKHSFENFKCLKHHLQIYLLKKNETKQFSVKYLLVLLK